MRQRIFQHLMGSEPVGTWVNLITPSSGQSALFTATACDGEGNIYTAGWTTSATTSVRAATLAKFNPTGVLLWARTLDTSNSDEFYALAVDSAGDVIAVGRSLQSGLIANYTSAGSLSWAKIVEGVGTTQFRGVAVDSSDNILIAGYDQRSPTAAIALKYDSSGNSVWRRELNGTSGDEFYGLAVDANDDVFLVGNTASSPASSFAALIAKYNSAGVFQWDKILNSASVSSFFIDAAIDASGNVVAGGWTTNDGLLVKYNTSGVLQWQRLIGGAGNDRPEAIEIDSAGGIILAGYTPSEGAGGNDVIVSKWSGAGTLEWQRTFGGPDDENSFSTGDMRVSLTPSDDIAISFVRDEAETVADLGSFVAVFPGDGTGTGSYGGYDYSVSTLTDSTATLTDTAITLTSGTPTFTESTTGLTSAPANIQNSLPYPIYT